MWFTHSFCSDVGWLSNNIGQALDLGTSIDHGNVLDGFTQERYDAMVKWKTAFYTSYLPVALAMYMTGNSDPEAHKNAKTILLKMGHFYQVQPYRTTDPRED
ncbi:Farnesyl pyrophosphate synthase [Holothuria leucospilota]|uniref:Farnesyl pyrophosphate synthase n=1 Tax=Holothuria leucospilota TaxID=206669 RepID=A0A9Q1C0H7_HOLLE|nr:Farnesyl pyrophosphate synthase [Holothuria leucospilota]